MSEWNELLSYHYGLTLMKSVFLFLITTTKLFLIIRTRVRKKYGEMFKRILVQTSSSLGSGQNANSWIAV